MYRPRKFQIGDLVCLYDKLFWKTCYGEIGMIKTISSDDTEYFVFPVGDVLREKLRKEYGMKDDECFIFWEHEMKKLSKKEIKEKGLESFSDRFFLMKFKEA